MAYFEFLQYCVTDGYTNFGQCCKQTCPFGYQPNVGFSCDPTAPLSSQCPSDTHYCNRMVGAGFSSSVCCQKPCREPTPIFQNGQCYAPAAYNSQCDLTIQCDGGVSMECVNGKCQCLPGFAPSRDPSKGRLTCEQRCDASSQVAVENLCISKSGLRDSCNFDIQCPENATCYQGKCECNCGFDYDFGRCTDSKILGKFSDSDFPNLNLKFDLNLKFSFQIQIFELLNSNPFSNP